MIRLIWTRAVAVCTLPLLMVITACSTDALGGKAELPSTLVDPARAKTPAGALEAYYSALVLLRDAVGEGRASYTVITAMLTDESMTPTIPASGNTYTGGNVDARIIPEYRTSNVGYTYYGVYSGLQLVRAQGNQAQQLLNDYATDSIKRPLMAHMLAAKAYAELLLAEAFCSGVPLSTLDYNGDYTLKAGSTTQEILNQALAKFDSAIALAGDSARVLNLARVGKGRTLLQLGQYAAAAQAVTGVPIDFVYDVNYNVDAKVCGLWDCSYGNGRFVDPIGDREGGNGMPFLSEYDARLPAVDTTVISTLIPRISRRHSIRFAGGVEAELIRAEGDLAANDPNWLVRVNALRTTCTDPLACASPAPAGSGGVAGLPPLADPGTDASRVDLLFRERAYWFYLSGHRQGDLRRLVRNYGRPENTVYPTGVYNADFSYGSDVTLPLPLDEQKLNPNSHGCFNRGA